MRPFKFGRLENAAVEVGRDRRLGCCPSRSPSCTASVRQMEATALSVGKSVLSGALSYAQSALAEEVALQLGVQRDQSFIADELEMMQGFLMAAHDKRNDNKVVTVWVKQVREMSYAVEDCLLDFAVRLERQSWWCLSRTLRDRRYVANQMKELRAKVEEVSQRNQRYHLIKGSGSKPTSWVAVSGATMSPVDEAVRQLNNAKQGILGLINSKNDDLRVIAIWGTGETSFEKVEAGVTPKAIIRSAYEDPNIHKKFECRAWIRLTSPVNLTDLIRSILRQFYVSSLREAKEDKKATLGPHVLELMETTKEQSLADEFKEYLGTKSYLIVLDDIHTIEEWDSIKAYFPSSNKGSRIVVFTDQVEVASLCVGAENRAPEHKTLFDDHSLFAFYNKDGMGPAEADSSSNMISASTDSSARKNTISPEESGLIERQTEEKEIIRLASNRDMEKFQVVSVWGMGGIGKTTLATKIYQSEEISGTFAKRACVTIKRPFNCDDLVSSLTKQLGKLDDLATSSGGKGYLLVLDDLWSITEWDAIMKYLPKMAASCIMVTTREKNIAQYCSKEEGKLYKLNTLGLDDARKLFAKKVFKDTVTLDGKDPELVKEAEVILKKCGGLPLALAVVGGFLASQPKTALEWRKFNDHISAELEMNPELGAIKAILIKSYDGLPYHLKACFLYLAIFPEDDKIARRRLVRQWIAEGYSREVRGKSEEEILDNYFVELVNRSMILPFQQSIYSRKGIDSCQVHDIIREIAVSQSMEENLVYRLEEGCSLNNRGTVRHLAISSNWKGDRCDFEKKIDLSHLRSLTMFGEWWRPFYISDEMRLLRVLDLENTSGLVDHYLEHIGMLLHLKYLSLRGCWGIFHLPDSLGNLRQLQTLDITCTCIMKLPSTIVKLKKLEYILASIVGGKINRRDVRTAVCCNLLPYFAAGRRAHGIGVPRGIGKLKALSTLHTVDISAGRAILEDIRRLTWLRKLGVTGINKRNGQGLCSAVAPLRCLESLSLRSDGEQGLLGCLDGPSSTPKNLQSLKLYGELVKLPEWIQGLKSLVKLMLDESRITEHDAAIKVLRDLPNLATLRLLYDSFVGAEVRLSFRRETFPSLKVLELNCIRGLELVEFEGGAPPKLELLLFYGWEIYQNVGLFSGLPHLLSLKEFMLHSLHWNTYFVKYLRGELAENKNGPVLKKYPN